MNTKKPYPAPTRCPVCGDSLQVTRLHCSACDSAVEGRFTLGRWQHLTPQQWEFVELFVRSRGKIKDMEVALNISYPTVVSRLNEVVEAMGFEVALPPADAAARRQKVLDELSLGTINAQEAAARLRALA